MRLTAIHAARRFAWFSVDGLVEATTADCAKADAPKSSAASAKRLFAHRSKGRIRELGDNVVTAGPASPRGSEGGGTESPRRRRHERSYFSQPRRAHSSKPFAFDLARPRSARFGPEHEAAKQTTEMAITHKSAVLFNTAGRRHVGLRRGDGIPKAVPASIACRRSRRVVQVRQLRLEGGCCPPSATELDAAAGTAAISPPRHCAPSPPASAARTHALQQALDAAKPLDCEAKTPTGAPRVCRL